MKATTKIWVPQQMDRADDSGKTEEENMERDQSQVNRPHPRAAGQASCHVVTQLSPKEGGPLGASGEGA